MFFLQYSTLNIDRSLSFVLYLNINCLCLFNLQNTKRLTVSIVKTMKMDSAVFVVAVSPDAKFIAVALLDYTVKA